MTRRSASFVAALLAAAPAALAGTSDVRVDVAPGVLRVEAPEAVTLPAVAPVPGRSVVTEAPLGPLRVVDARGSGGWTLVVQSGPMTDSLGRAMSEWLEMAPPASPPAGVEPGAGGTLDRPRTVATVPAGVVVPRAVLWPTLRLRVPGDAASGAYRTTLTVTIA